MSINDYYKEIDREKYFFKKRQLKFYTSYLQHLSRFINEVEVFTQLEDENSLRDLQILEVRKIRLNKRMFREVLRPFK